jgi:(4-alkanoyl-5-oxo-2,5-dihydrofuran-3-yl)methyl phosphate reductase
MILVTGATGTVGREVVAQLLAAGHQVRALVRQPSKAQVDARVQLVEGDLTKPDTLEDAVVGVDRIFSVALGPTLAEQESALTRAAIRAGARHIVKLSVLGAGVDTKQPGVIAWHSAAERAIDESGIRWTFVRPGVFMSNALYWRDMITMERRVFSNFGDGKVPVIHPRDVAAVAVRALTTPGHEGQVYALTGPEALSVADQVRIIERVVGARIDYVPVGDDLAREDMQKAAMPSYLADALLSFAPVVRAGNAAGVLGTVEEVTGRRALTFAEWAREHISMFV